jgi:hypothetical protein
VVLSIPERLDKRPRLLRRKYLNTSTKEKLTQTVFGGFGKKTTFFYFLAQFL